MKKSTLLLTIILGIFQISIAQNIIYNANSSNDVIINDAIYLNDNFYLVGKEISSNRIYPKFIKINPNGNVLIDTTLPLTEDGYFSNIVFAKNELHISNTFTTFGTDKSCYDFVVDTNFITKNFVYIEDGNVTKSKQVSDSTIIYIGQYYDTFINLYVSFISLHNLNTGNVISDYHIQKQNPVELYDVIKNKNGYSYFANSPDSLLSIGVFQYNVDDSLYVLDSFALRTTNSQFNANQSLLGPISAVEITDSTFISNSIIFHPTYLNQQNSLDAGISIYNIDGTEQNVQFAGKSDTNSSTSNNSIAKAGNYFYAIATENSSNINNSLSNILITKINLQGNIIWSQHFSNNANLKVKKILSFKGDSLLIIGTSQATNSSPELAFALKTDTSSNGIINSIKELDQYNSISIYPNPSRFAISLDIKDPTVVNHIKEMSILNIDGKVITTYNSNYQNNINIENLKSGIYFLKIDFVDYSKTLKFIKVD